MELPQLTPYPPCDDEDRKKVFQNIINVNFVEKEGHSFEEERAHEITEDLSVGQEENFCVDERKKGPHDSAATDTAAVEKDATTAAPKRKGCDSPSKLQHKNLKATIRQPVLKSMPLRSPSKSMPLPKTRLLATAKKQVVHNAKLYSEFAHPVVETAATNDARLVALAKKLAASDCTELVPEADYKKQMVELEVASDAIVETLQRSFDDAIDNMITKMPNLADKLNDLRLRQARRAKTRRASSRVTGLVRSPYAVVSNDNFGAMTRKTDDTFVIASESSLKKRT
ncbi:hypothetical protein Pyn_20648 [Prunus yedoensis var. nudiflora]|uniref:Uncharacterized protein n=1 Tax=Prunus yedoensis var. nudiflora TaxID=2094558 RepID=A0A314UVF0_PRUYE|nr:hypothetical protein Pyn_20648 [Prunus yedoensis var. nudiflora]